ncbi:MAG: LON peptidase substrate-binding domain-containing protein [Bacteroidales bacterium]|nr:LON peptidase substrate-binding domain-containing protein [Bacteroidales bacterium]
MNKTIVAALVHQNQHYMVSKSFTLPLFPLSVIMLPGERKPLHIFEKRYKDLVYDINMTGNATFGIPYVFQGEVTNYGSLVHVNKIFSPNKRGEFDIIVECINLFKMDEYYTNYENKLYDGGKIHLLKLTHHIHQQRLIELFSRYQREIQQDSDEPQSVEGPGNIIDVARQIPLSMEEKYVFMKHENCLKREKMLIGKLRLLFYIKEKENQVGTDFVYN